LIELKCDVNIADKNGETALHLAAKNGQHKAAKTLLQHNADHSLVSLSIYHLYIPVISNFRWPKMAKPLFILPAKAAISM